MKCPHCADATLVMTERAGVEIDYCPTCRGVWLDRGELDKIIQRAATAEERAAPVPPQAAANVQPPPQQQHYQQPPPQQYYGRKPDDSHYGYPSPYGYPKKRKSWLSEIFD